METKTENRGNSNVAIVAILAVVILAAGGIYMFTQGEPSDGAQSSAPAQQEEDSGFSFEFQDDDGEGVKFEGDG